MALRSNYEQVHSFEQYILEFEIGYDNISIQKKGERRQRWQRCHIKERRMGFDTSGWVGVNVRAVIFTLKGSFRGWLTHSLNSDKNLNARIGKHVRAPGIPKDAGLDTHFSTSNS